MTKTKPLRIKTIVKRSQVALQHSLLHNTTLQTYKKGWILSNLSQ